MSGMSENEYPAQSFQVCKWRRGA